MAPPPGLLCHGTRSLADQLEKNAVGSYELLLPPEGLSLPKSSGKRGVAGAGSMIGMPVNAWYLRSF